jgi:hypothetical protein
LILPGDLRASAPDLLAYRIAMPWGWVACTGNLLLPIHSQHVLVQLVSLERGYFFFWMNTWDMMVLTVALTLAISTAFNNFTFVVRVNCAFLHHLN